MGSDSVLLDLKILNGDMFLKFDKYVNNYTVNVASDVDTLEIGIPDEKLRCVHGSWRENKCLKNMVVLRDK